MSPATGAPTSSLLVEDLAGVARYLAFAVAGRTITTSDAVRDLHTWANGDTRLLAVAARRLTREGGPELALRLLQRAYQDPPTE